MRFPPDNKFHRFVSIFALSSFNPAGLAVIARTHCCARISCVGISTEADNLASNLSYGDQRRLEIARALATQPKLLALDEPAAGMNATETKDLRLLIQRIQADGISILLIEHDVKLIMSLCDRVAVLDYGQKIAEDVADIVRKDRRVVKAYLGGELP